MTTPTRTSVLAPLRRVALLRDGGGMTDGQLLECFLARREEAAFEGLVRRHGPMVLGVCRRLLPNEHDAEDAFQATFLVLARKATSIVPQELVGNWLYGVAYRTALKAKATTARRRAMERQVKAMPEPRLEADSPWQDLRPLLDRELHRLSDKYRIPVVLCELEGKSRKEVARRLGIPEGTLSSRLAAARKQLAQRLARRGLALSAGSLALVLSEHAASACVPSLLLGSTVKGATLFATGQAITGVVSPKVAALTNAVLKAMLMTKVVTLVLLALGLLGTATGMVVGRSPAPEPGRNTEAREARLELALDAVPTPVPPPDQADEGREEPKQEIRKNPKDKDDDEEDDDDDDEKERKAGAAKGAKDRQGKDDARKGSKNAGKNKDGSRE